MHFLEASSPVKLALRHACHTLAARACEAFFAMVKKRLERVAGLRASGSRRDERMRVMRLLQTVGVASFTAVALAGCGGASGGGGDPGARPLPPGQSCQSVFSEMRRLEGRGVQSSIERQQRGGALSPSQKADADSYNRLLNDYLDARCHV